MLATYCWRQQLAKIKVKEDKAHYLTMCIIISKKYYFFITNVVFEFNTFSLKLMGDRAIWLSYSD